MFTPIFFALKVDDKKVRLVSESRKAMHAFWSFCSQPV